MLCNKTCSSLWGGHLLLGLWQRRWTSGSLRLHKVYILQCPHPRHSAETFGSFPYLCCAEFHRPPWAAATPEHTGEKRNTSLSPSPFQDHAPQWFSPLPHDTPTPGPNQLQCIVFPGNVYQYHCFTKTRNSINRERETRETYNINTSVFRFTTDTWLF